MNYLIRQCLLWLLLYPLFLQGQERLGNFQHITEADGLSNNEVYFSVQDKQGFIWSATRSGLCRYDGYDFQNFTVEDGIARNDIRKVFIDSQSRIWIPTRRELSVFNGNNFITPLDSLEFIKDDRVIDILEDQEGRIWFSTSVLLSYLDKNGKQGEVRIKAEKLGTLPRLLFVNSNNEVYVRYGSQLIIVQGEEIKAQYPFDHLPKLARYNSQILLRQNKDILYSSPKGLIRFNPRGEDEIFFEDFPANFNMGELTQIFEDQDGDLWLAHETEGILRIDQNKNTEQLFRGSGINHIMQDIEGDLWFSSSEEGLFLLSKNAIEMRKTQLKLSHNLSKNQFLEEIEVVDMDGNIGGDFFIADKKQVYEVSSLSGRFIINQLPTLELDPSEEIKDLLCLSPKSILVQTEDRFLSYQNESWSELYGLFDPSSMSKAKNGGLLLTYDREKTIRLDVGELLKLRDPGQADAFLEKKEIGINLINSKEGTQMTLEDVSGIIWGVWPNGLYRILGEENFSYPNGQNSLKARTFDLLSSPDSILWVATNGSGLLALKGEELSSINEEDGMEGLVCNDLYYDEKSGELWIATQTGLGRINTYDFEKDQFEVKWFDTNDGLHTAKLRDVYEFGGHIWIAGEKGLSILDKSKIQEEFYKPPVYITGISRNGKEIEFPENNLLLSNEENNISIYFTGISFRNRGKLSFEYRLNETDWMPINSNPLRFESLKTGKYTVRIKAISRDGLETEEPLEFNFEVAPQFYETWWFLGLLIFTFAALGLGLIRYLYSERQRIILEDTVEEKTYELNLKIEELHRSNQDLKQFAYVASHDLKTPLRTVIGHLQLLKRKLGTGLDKDEEKAMNFAVESSKGMYEMINHLLDYSRLGRESLEFESFNLGDILAELKKSLMSVIEERNAEIHFEAFPNFIGVPAQWKILFQNLIENAIKFNESDAPQVIISYKDSPDFWILSVKDNGIGIKEEYQPKIFDLFQRLHSTEYPGSGIGLAKCKRIVELHGGSIWIDSVEGAGTDFQFTISKRLELI
ncbi:MAG: ATP-binding protein [Bacteroidia bacterium]|nr:ATP-binding protein [Bacteroidia bacterium]